MKILAIFLLILAIAICIVPMLTDCESQGLMLTLADGRQIPMKCHWTAVGELALGIPLSILAIELFLSRRRETRINLGVLGGALGVLVILLPTILIGVCAKPDMLCNSVMKPALILAGSLVILISLVITILSVVRKEVQEPGA